MWYDASQITGLANGANVPQWDDASGFANHASNASSSQQPNYQTGVINGRPVVRFNGTTDHLDVPSTDALALTNNAAGITVIAVADLTTPGAATRQLINFSAGTGSSTNRFKYGQRLTGSGVWAVSVRRDDAGTSVNIESAGASETGFCILTAVSDWANADAFLYRNGILVASTTDTTLGSANTSATNSTSVRLGARADGAAEWWLGDIAELRVYDAALTTTEREAIEAELNTTYGFGPPPEPPVLESGPIMAVTYGLRLG